MIFEVANQSSIESINHKSEMRNEFYPNPEPPPPPPPLKPPPPPDHPPPPPLPELEGALAKTDDVVFNIENNPSVIEFKPRKLPADIWSNEGICAPPPDIPPPVLSVPP